MGVLYGFRNPAASGLSFPEMYARVLQQIALVDQLGFDHVWITEHHFVEDGYMPSPLVMSGAIAARTSRVAIGQDVMLLPFTNPVRLAEDLIVLDNLSNGRMMVGAGMGYVPSEFAALGIPRRERRQRMDETLEILRRAFTEEEFDFDGTHFQLQRVRVRPRPVQPGGPPVWVAAMGEPGARRAARFDAHLLPQGDRRAVLDPWRSALADRGRDASDYRVGIARPFVVNDDPSAAASSNGVALAKVAAGGPIPHESMRVYEAWLRELSPADRMKTQLIEGNDDGTLIPQDAFIGSADACIAEALRMYDEYGITDIIVPGYTGAQPPEAVDANLVRLANEVLPALRGRLSTRGGNASPHQKDHRP
jgi:alkanesulfonate monooxygenase SsuD/methylene tetrahydromethanopterin reductase-like flavin-dependent oxidoreductase (luciferase family)